MATLTGEIVDPVGIVVQYLLDQVDLTNLVDKRIFGGLLPPGSAQLDNAVTIRIAGGPREIYQEVIIRPRFELRCYGATEEDAAQVYWRVYRLLNGKLNISANDGRVLSIWISSGGTVLYDEVLNKPFMLAFMESFVQAEALSA
ncbi:hypothetical protein LCGC14_0577580 [marine sediment metagenome]|uniref:Uncharacterized protein n=1 Tax=marine sediment metagenome TaxID=412755 RepID=A0A0F9RHF6_9ZZZZ